MLWWQSHSSICICKVDLCFYWIRVILYVDDEIHYVIVNFHVYPELDNFSCEELLYPWWAELLWAMKPLSMEWFWFTDAAICVHWNFDVLSYWENFLFQWRATPSPVGWAGANHKARRDGTVMHYWYKHICVFWYFSRPRAELIFFQYKPSLCTVGRAGTSHKACTDGTVQHDWYNHVNDNKMNFLLLTHVFQWNISHINRVWA